MSPVMAARDAELNALLQRWLFAGMAVAIATGLGLVGRAYFQASGGALVYWIEDAYIHLAMARNLALHGVFGATPHEFTTSSSSPLWVLLLAAAMLVTGPDMRLGLALNLLAALAFAAIAARVLGSSAESNRARWLAGVAAALLALLVAPLPLILSGMEHLGHAAAMVLAVWWLSRRLSDDTSRVNDAALLALLLVLPLWRYESLWLHVLGIAVALARRDWRFAFLVAVAGALPVCGFGWIAQYQGWPFLPAPILAKTVYLAEVTDGWLVWAAKYFLWWPLKRLFVYVPELLVLMVVGDCWLAWMLWRNPEAWRSQRWLAVLFFLLGSWTHATFASFGWGGRYEAYLLAIGLVTLGAALPTSEWRRLVAARWRGLLVGVLGALFVVAAAGRLWHQHRDLPGRAETVALRDLAPARIVAAACSASPCPFRVMAMNVGALSWFAGPRLTDLMALADREVLALARDRRLDSAAVRRLADKRQIDIALLFEDWYATSIGGGPPLVKVGTFVQQTDWPTPLSVYALNEGEARALAGRLKPATLPRKLVLELEPAFR
ncbi:MAG TPA: hypothetical protein VEC14_11105 [Reyranellaceae bacterium]|nr:hypothetical protein [Reyranellaceae bacterium]